MKVVYSDHAEKRLRQRGITTLEIEHVLKYPIYVKKSYEGRKEAVGEIRNRTVKIAFEERENYINIISVM